MDRIIAIERLLKTYHWFNGMLESPDMDKEMMKTVIDRLIKLWTRELEQEYLSKKLEEESISHDYETAIDYAEREEED